MARFTGAQRQKIRKHTREQRFDPSEAAGELNVVPFLDIVVNLIMFLLIVTASAVSFAQVDANLPAYDPRPGVPSAHPDNQLNLQVTLVPEGAIVTGAQGKLAADCTRTGAGAVVTVPRLNAEYDWAQLSACLTIVNHAYPGNDRVILSADPQVEYEHLIAAMDAINASEGASGGVAPLEILLAGGVR